ncbi:conjugal transfer protein [Streptomyces sp. SID8014]|uniref:conjugal transfer protein n=1 Tax=Streptomyces sp. SID8014 TaxID=2706097 RepID=UPI0013BA472C|nr:conjugal transfer protein [Streptomyces sp. SID8014]
MFTKKKTKQAAEAEAEAEQSPQQVARRKLTAGQKWLLGLVIAPMLAVGVAGGIGTYGNISGKYGSSTATGALAAGEGATVVLALVLLITTLLGQAAPSLVRLGLWLLPAAAGVMGATAAEGAGQTIVYGLTPMAITAAAEGIAFLARRVVVYQDQRDVEAETRAAQIVRDLAYHHARSTSHPIKLIRKTSELKSWRLARRVGTGDVRLGADLMDIQRERVGAGADAALGAMFSGKPAAESPRRGKLRGKRRGAAPELAPAAPSGTEAPEGTDGTALGAGVGHDRGTESPQVNGSELPAAARISAHLRRLDWEPLAGKPASVIPAAPASPAALTASAPAAPAPAPASPVEAAPQMGKPEQAPGKPEGKQSGKPLVDTLAQAVRESIEDGVTDPKALRVEVPKRLATAPKPDSLRREINRQLPKLVSSGASNSAGPYL